MLMKGNEAVGEAAIRAGCRYFFGYPITPQNEIPEYMSRRLPAVGGVFLQAESELAAINMVYGAAGAGARVMTSSSGPGISLKSEGISYIAGAELPCVIVNMVRAGPGLGGIQPAQSDYFQATKGGGHGDYRVVVLGPGSVQELADLVMDAFDIADRYRNPVMIMGDGILGQMMEPVEFKERPLSSPDPKPWATTGAKGRKPNIITSIHIDPEVLDRHNWHLQEKYREIVEREARFEIVDAGDSEIFLVAYGTTARICRGVVEKLRERGLKIGLVRPITLWPFPARAFDEVCRTGRAFLTVEMSTGQMVEDVRLAVAGRRPVYFYGRTGGALPSPKAIMERVLQIADGREPDPPGESIRKQGGA
ncbi:MAG: 3-methyl-2-oxobutanoate dehydrogenase subunit VorB [Firmicutes bacterium]|jgi:2-oxoglutarate ferredoxin oxidoreductase subunit alpha|nr:3-methyl-2-oxobutanoate dehydrogenase subunit VorB [Bacillota bacterium]